MKDAIRIGACAMVVAACGRGGVRVPVLLSVEEHAIPWANAFPSDVVVDGDGVGWFTDRVAHVIGRFDPETGSFDSIATPTRNSAPYGLIMAPDGRLWYAASRAGKLGRLDPKTKRIEEHTIPGAHGGPHLIAWQDGRIWYSLRESNAFGWYDTRSGATRIYTARDRDRPYSVAIAPDGNVWFDVLDGWRLYEVDARTDSVRVHDLSEAPAPGQPWGYYGALDGAGRMQQRALWDSADVSKLDPAEQRRVWPNRQRGQAKRMTIDAGGGVWVTDFARDRVIRFDAQTGETRAYVSPEKPARPYGIAGSGWGQVWFSEMSSGLLVMMDATTGERRTVRIPATNATIRQIAVDEKRLRVWLPMSDAGRIGLVRLAR
jgi:virginiamycin B lyase